jgi:hypothetical protein
MVIADCLASGFSRQGHTRLFGFGCPHATAWLQLYIVKSADPANMPNTPVGRQNAAHCSRRLLVRRLAMAFIWRLEVLRAQESIIVFRLPPLKIVQVRAQSKTRALVVDLDSALDLVTAARAACRNANPRLIPVMPWNPHIAFVESTSEDRIY